jgi:hypothetical protein
LLLALILDRGVVGRAFADLEITYKAASETIVETLGRGSRRLRNCRPSMRSAQLDREPGT